MNKKVKVTSLAAAALTSVVLAGANLNHEVKAATVPEGTSAKAQSAQDNAQANVESAQKEVDSAQSDVNTAKSNLDSAQGSAQTADSAYNDQNNKAQTAQKNENDKKTALDKTQDAQKKAQQLVNDSKDSAKAKQANNDVTNKQNAVKTAQDAQKTADQKVSDQNKVVAKDQTAVDSATKVRDQKQTAKNSADAQVKTAEDALKGTGIAEAKSALDQANTNLAKAQAALDQANQAVAKLQSDQKTAQSNLNRANANKAIGEKSQKAAQSAYDLALKNVQNAEKAVKDQQKLVDDLNNQLKSLQISAQNKIVIPDMEKYKKAYADYQTTHELTQDDKDYMDAARAQNKYVASDADKKEMVDVNNISDDQIKDISLFTVNLLNQLRKQFGWEADAVSDGAIQLAKDVAKGYLNDHFDDFGHDNKAVNEAADKNGLSTPNISDGSRDQSQGYEDMKSSSIDTPTLSMADLKGEVYKSINEMILTDGQGYDELGGPRYELGHARGLLGADEHSTQIVPDGVYAKQQLKDTLKKDIENAINQVKDDPGAVSRTIVSDDNGDGEYDITVQNPMYSHPDNTPYEISIIHNRINYTADDVFQELDKEINAPASKQYVAVVPTNDSTTGMPFRIHIVNVSQSQIADKKKFSTNEVPTYETQIDKLQKEILAQEDKLKQLQNDNTSFNKDLTTKKEQLDKLNKAVNDSTNQAKAAQDKLNGVTKELGTVTADQTSKSKQVNSDSQTQKVAQDKYNALTADNKTKTANLEKAQTAQKQAQSELDDAQSKLNDAQKTLDDAKNNFETLQKDAQSKGDAVKQAQTALETAQKYVEDLKNAPQILKTANDAEAKAQTEYDAAKKAADEAEAQLKNLENEKSAADGQVATAQSTYDEALARLKSAQDKLAKAKEALNNIQNDQKTISTPDQKPVEKKRAKSTKKAKKVSSHVRLTHNAFVYTKSGKAIRSGLHFKLVRRGKTVKALKNAKIVTIKGKRFYQIGKNQFIKVANAKIVTHAVHVKAVIKGKKVRAYDRLGKLNKHSVKGGHTYTFNEKAVINGKTYYKIAWTNNWIPASKLNLKK